MSTDYRQQSLGMQVPVETSPLWRLKNEYESYKNETCQCVFISMVTLTRLYIIGRDESRPYNADS